MKFEIIESPGEDKTCPGFLYSGGEVELFTFLKEVYGKSQYKIQIFNSSSFGIENYKSCLGISESDPKALLIIFHDIYLGSIIYRLISPNLVFVAHNAPDPRESAIRDLHYMAANYKYNPISMDPITHREDLLKKALLLRVPQGCKPCVISDLKWIVGATQGELEFDIDFHGTNNHEHVLTSKSIMHVIGDTLRDISDRSASSGKSIIITSFMVEYSALFGNPSQNYSIEYIIN